MERPKIVRDLDGTMVTVEQCPPRRGIKVAIRILSMIGRPLANALTGAPIRLGKWRATWPQLARLLAKETVTLERLSDDEKSWQSAEASTASNPELAGAWIYMLREAVDVLDALDPDEVLALADDLLIGQCTIAGQRIGGGEQTDEAARALIDALFPDAITLLGAVKLGIEVNAGPIFAALRTRDDSATART